jgi:hypothetical protein
MPGCQRAEQDATAHAVSRLINFSACLCFHLVGGQKVGDNTAAGKRQRASDIKERFACTFAQPVSHLPLTSILLAPPLSSKFRSSITCAAIFNCTRGAARQSRKNSWRNSASCEVCASIARPHTGRQCRAVHSWRASMRCHAPSAAGSWRLWRGLRSHSRGRYLAAIAPRLLPCPAPQTPPAQTPGAAARSC